jgi:hypothetical protein
MAILRTCIDSTRPASRTACVRQFQELISGEAEQIGSVSDDRVLRDLAHDLDFYEPDPRVRREDISFYDDAELE